MTELRPYQSAAVEWITPRQRGMVVAPAGSGKTIIAAHAAARVLRPGQRALWVANTREQVDQAVRAIQSTEGADGVGSYELVVAGAARRHQYAFEEEFQTINEILVSAFGGSSSAKDRARALRDARAKAKAGGTPPPKSVDSPQADASASASSSAGADDEAPQTKESP